MLFFFIKKKKLKIKYYINSPKDSNLCGSSSLQEELLAVWQLISLQRVSNMLRVLPWQLLPRHQDSNSAIMHIIVEDDQGKAIAWHLVSYKMTWYKFSVCILYSVCSLHFVTSLHFVPGQQSAVWILYWPDWYCCFCSSEPQVPKPKYWSSQKIFSETTLAAMIDVWTVCWGAPGEKHSDRAMITVYQLKTNVNALLTNMAASDALLRAYSVCWNEPATGPLGVNISASRFKLHFQKFGKVIWGYYFY